MNYHDSPALSRSQLWDAYQSMAGYWASHVCQPPLIRRKVTRAMEFGTLVHELFADPFAATPVICDARRGTKQWAAAKAHADRHRLSGPWSSADYKRAAFMASAMFARIARWTKRSSETCYERELFWTDKESGLAMRAKPDLVMRVNGKVIVFDAKTHAQGKRFATDLSRFGYWIQDIHYSEGIRQCLGESPVAFIFIAVEDQPLHRCQLHQLDPRDREACHDAWRSTVNEIALHRANDWRDLKDEHEAIVKHRVRLK